MLEKILKNFFIILVMQIFCTTIILFAASVIIWKCATDETAVSAVVIGTYILINIVGGIFAGKMFEKNKFLWGLAVGIIYFAVLMCIGLLVLKNGNFGINVVSNALICAISGMVGGMVTNK